MARIDELLARARDRGASAVHVAPARLPHARVRGELLPLADDALAPGDVEAMLVELLDPAQRARLAADHAIAFVHAQGDGARFRGQIVQAIGGLRAVFRVVPAAVPTLAELAYPEIVWRLADVRRGLVGVASPPGSGRTTSLSAIVDHVNKTRACHVVTIEDVIEVVHEPVRAQITQREIGAHAPSVAAALRNAARENADVVVVSTLRTHEDVAAAVALASAGVAVFAGLPANGVVSSVEYLLARSEGDPGLLADALAGVIAQLLVKNIAVHEVWVGSAAGSAALRQKDARALAALMRAGEGQGMLTFDLAFERLMRAGKLTPEEAFELSFDKEAFAKLVTGG